jgi:hypothetical protein
MLRMKRPLIMIELMRFLRRCAVSCAGEDEEAGHLNRCEAVRPLLVDPSGQTAYVELAGVLDRSNGLKHCHLSGLAWLG